MAQQRVQSLRSSVTTNRPAVGSRQPGELYVNFADFQMGVIDASQTAQDLVAVRYFSVNANYNIGDYAVYSGNLYRAKVAITAGAFNAVNWDRIQTAADVTTGYLPLTGGTLTGNLNVSSATNSQLILKPASGWTSVSLQKSGSSQFNQVAGYTGNNARWSIQPGDGTAETGANNTGSNFSISRYNDAGAYIDTPFSIDRSRGLISLGPVSIPANAVSTAAAYSSYYIASGSHTLNVYPSTATNAWSYNANGFAAVFSLSSSGAQIAVAPSGPAGSAVASWTGSFNFGSAGNFNANGSIIAGSQLQGATLNVALAGTQPYTVYASGTQCVKQYQSGWYDTFNNSGGLRNWVGGNVSLMTLDGSGNLSVGGAGSIGSNLTVGNVMTVASANGIQYSALSGYYFAWGWNGQIFVYVNGGNQYYVPHGYPVGGAQTNISSWAYNSNGNIYATETGGTQRVWATSSSDRKLKSNIVKSNYDALKAINALNIVSCDMKFNYLDDAPAYHWDCALIADEVEPIIPMAYVAPIKYKDRMEVPGEGPVEEKESLAYIRELALTTTLIKAVQQLTEQVQTLQARIATLEAR